MTDPTVKLELDYCVPRGIPHSTFLTWDRDDRDKALWWLIHQRQACSSCGTRPDAWDEANGGDRNAYVAEPHFCRGCQVAARGDEWLERHRKQVPRGTTMRLVPRSQARDPLEWEAPAVL